MIKTILLLVFSFSSMLYAQPEKSRVLDETKTNQEEQYEPTKKGHLNQDHRNCEHNNRRIHRKHRRSRIKMFFSFGFFGNGHHSHYYTPYHSHFFDSYYTMQYPMYYRPLRRPQRRAFQHRRPSPRSFQRQSNHRQSNRRQGRSRRR